ncbi:MAG: 2-C-methyl-D-erythritol 4-phosphate cytidylyltransferase [Synergistales bacterium]|nr:2-C-methyl-D-erythritol 4-phosphate cytidylyltransferase [Synergistales bacterium]
MSFSCRRISTVALIPAAGSGLRLGMGPKALLELGGRTILERILENVEGLVDRIIIGAPEEYLPIFSQIAGNRADVHSGGDTRQKTVYKLFEKTTEDMILVHDVSWPFVTRAVFGQVLEKGVEKGAASAVTKINVPVGCCKDGKIREYLRKEDCCLSQTPQAYSHEVLKFSFSRAFEKRLEFQSLAQLVTHGGFEIDAVFIEEPGIKITYPIDLEIARKVMLMMEDLRDQ